MSIVVESGAGLPDAESFASVADADTYHASRGNAGWAGNAGWTGNTSAKEAALIRATDFLDGAYRTRWLGQAAVPAQALTWPRAYVRDTAQPYAFLPSDAVPRAVIRACCECALRELESPGGLAPDIAPGQRITSEGVGPLSVSYADDGAASAVLPVLVIVDRLLAPLLRSAAGGGLVMRA